MKHLSYYDVNAISTLLDCLKIDYPPYGSFKVAASSDTIRWRAKTFHVKEPTTLQWIQSLEKNAVLIDVGANIGIYTLPSALYHVKKVISLEPEIKNYNELVKNIEINDIGDKVDALPLAVSTEFANLPSDIYLTKDEPGFSCHQVGRNQNYKLQELSVMRKKRSVYCIPLSSVVLNACKNHPSSPIHIKIDVDGIEEDICQSLFASGAFNHINSIQVELNPSIIQHNNLIKRLHSHGFSYSKIQVSRASRKSGEFKNFAEYVFRRYAAKSFLDNLPSRVSNKFSAIGNEQDKSDISGYIIGTKNQFKFKQLFNRKSFKSIAISTTPPALSIPNFMTALECISAFNSISQCVSKSFNFETHKGFKDYSESNRLSISSKQLIEIDKHYVRYLIDFALDVPTLRLIFKSILPLLGKYLHIKKDRPLIHGKKVSVRIRHFLDINGFYLARHHDSVDTLFALICPLAASSTTTSLFSSVSEGPSILMSNRDDKRFRLGSQFDRNIFYSPIPVSDNVFETQRSDTGDVASFYIHNPNLQQGDALIIPNINFNFFAKVNPAYKNAPDTCGHGVFPPISDVLRPVLLIDYIASDIDGSDKYSVPLLVGDASIFADICPLEDLAVGI